MPGAALLVICAAQAFGQTSNWTGATDNQWFTGTNWDAGVPNSATSTAVVNSSVNNPVILTGGAATVAAVSVGSSNTLVIENASSLTANTVIGINTGGTISLNSAGGDTDLIMAGGTNVQLIGGGTLDLSASNNNRIYGFGNASLTSSDTIQGAGQIGVVGGFTLTNQGAGIVNANQSGAGLQLLINDNVTNAGTLEATAGGTLNLNGIAVTNTGGLILASGAGSVVSLTGATSIDGGTLTTSLGGSIQSNGSATLNNVTISGGSSYATNNASSTIIGGTLTNNGTFALNSTGGDTDMIIASGTSATLNGSGSVVMSNSANNRIYGFGNASLTNNQTISGAGQIGVVGGFALNNNGIVNANLSAALSIDDVVNNTGTLEATSGGTLTLFSGTVTNTGAGEILAGAGSTVNLSGLTINGGLLTGPGNLVNTGGGVTLNAVTIDTGTTFTTTNANPTTIAGGVLTNNGTFALNSTGGDTDLIIASGTNASLNGSGPL
jgi:hypothetical protein